jgi:hypothetical protein
MISQYYRGMIGKLIIKAYPEIFNLPMSIALLNAQIHNYINHL